MRQALLIAGITAALATAVPSPSQAQPAAEPSVVSRHEIRLAGRTLGYEAEAGRIAIRDVATGEPRGFMFYTAYRVPSPGRPRPVTFVWNGGPGAASTLLHFEVAGPKRVEDGRLVDNADTWLTHSDLVFVDPIGTGFSRPARREYAEEFYGTLGDVASVTEFVRAWRILHGAQDAPTFLAGESWGAGRAANVGHALLKRGVRVDGLALISGGAGLRPPPAAAADIEAQRVVNLAAVAAHHGRGGGDPQAIARWARETYAPALRAGASLADAERAAIAAKLAEFTGLPPERIDRDSLVVTPRQFRTGLIEGRTLDVFDMRLSEAGESLPTDRLLAYFRSDLGYRTDLPYVGLEAVERGYAPGGDYPASVGARWNYATGPVTPEEVQAAMAEAMRTAAGPPQLGPPLPGTVEAVALNPRLKVLVASGLYDSLANCAGADEIARRLAPDVRAAMSFRCYEGGHMMYRDPAARTQLSRDVREMIGGSR
ncbi:MAG: S10 family serine carboxypeptidase-like protein [Phenylobacterium sp.]|uniref:S10 family serine carboxypeptidase-like protein n=1 Tax=Phenylobacterium sp. TaxID=1871053 RepID=UPI00391BE755